MPDETNQGGTKMEAMFAVAGPVVVAGIFTALAIGIIIATLRSIRENPAILVYFVGGALAFWAMFALLPSWWALPALVAISMGSLGLSIWLTDRLAARRTARRADGAVPTPAS